MSEAYTKYIAEHVENVRTAFEWMARHGLVDEAAEPFAERNVDAHDLSKYGADEYDAYDRHFYGSRPAGEDKDFDYAWLHHIHANPHHWQHWVLKSDDGSEKALEMPREYVYEMIADWLSFGVAKGDLSGVFEWYEKHKGMTLHPSTRKLVEDVLGKIKAILEEGRV